MSFIFERLNEFTKDLILGPEEVKEMEEWVPHQLTAREDALLWEQRVGELKSQIEYMERERRALLWESDITLRGTVLDRFRDNELERLRNEVVHMKEQNRVEWKKASLSKLFYEKNRELEELRRKNKSLSERLEEEMILKDAPSQEKMENMKSELESMARLNLSCDVTSVTSSHGTDPNAMNSSEPDQLRDQHDLDLVQNERTCRHLQEANQGIRDLQEEMVKLRLELTDARDARDKMEREAKASEDLLLRRLRRSEYDVADCKGQNELLKEELEQVERDLYEAKDQRDFLLNDKGTEIDSSLKVEVAEKATMMEILDCGQCGDMDMNVASSKRKVVEVAEKATMTEILQCEDMAVETDSSPVEVADKATTPFISSQDLAEMLMDLDDREAENISISAENARLRDHLIEVERERTQESLQAKEREVQLSHLLKEAGRHAAFLKRSEESAHAELKKLQLKLSEVSSGQEDGQEGFELLEKERDDLKKTVALLRSTLRTEVADEACLWEARMDRLRRDHHEQDVKATELEAEVATLTSQLNEANCALEKLPALQRRLKEKTELANQLQTTIFDIRDESLKLQREHQALEVKSRMEMISKQTLKTYFQGYFGAPASKKEEALRLIAVMAGYDQAEQQHYFSTKKSGWRSWFGGSSQPKPNPSPVGGESLLDGFNRFVEAEIARATSR